MVHPKGLEPLRRKALEPKSNVSADSTTGAYSLEMSFVVLVRAREPKSRMSTNSITGAYVIRGETVDSPCI